MTMKKTIFIYSTSFHQAKIIRIIFVTTFHDISVSTVGNIKKTPTARSYLMGKIVVKVQYALFCQFHYLHTLGKSLSFRDQSGKISPLNCELLVDK